MAFQEDPGSQPESLSAGVFCKERNARLKTQNGMAGGSPVLCFSEFHTPPLDGAFISSFLFLLAFQAPVAETRRSDGWGAQTLTWGVSPCGVSSPVGSRPETQGGPGSGGPRGGNVGVDGPGGPRGRGRPRVLGEQPGHGRVQAGAT